MKILIPVFSPAMGTWGGLTRILAVAEAAQNAGHEVAFCASGYLEKALRQRGYQMFSMPETTMFGLPKVLAKRVEKNSQKASIPVKPGMSVGSLWFVMTISGMTKGNYLEKLLTAQLLAVLKFKPDVIFTDLDPAAFMTARLTQIPFAAAHQHIMRKAGKVSLFRRLMRQAIRRALDGKISPIPTPDELFFDSSVLKIVPSIPELDGADPTKQDVCYVGQLLGDIQAKSDFQPEEGRRYVFVYMGTGSVSMENVRAVLSQVFPAEGQYRCLVGGPGITQTEKTGGVEYMPYVPVESVLPYCDWVFCHGGQNTIIQALRQGVPLIVIPGAIFERRFNGQKVQENGAGFMGEIPDFTAEWLCEKMAQQAQCAQKAAALGEKIRSYGGAQAAVAALERIGHKENV